jgi:hypothetical protein
VFRSRGEPWGSPTATLTVRHTRSAPAAHQVFFRDITRTLPFGALLHAMPCNAPMPRHRLDDIRCASFRTLLLPAGVEIPARAVYDQINRQHYALVHRQPTFSLALLVPCRNVGGHGEDHALTLELERLAPNVVCSTQKNGIKLKGKRMELLAQNQQFCLKLIGNTSKQTTN